MSKQPLRLAFAGTPDFAARHLQALLASEHELLAVYTQPDRPAGRGKKVQPGAVKQVAVGAGLPVLQPVSLKAPDAQQQLRELGADLMVVVAYGLILPAAVLAIPRHGCLNVHASLLPRWRGAAPIQRAIEAGDAVTGITIMQMDAGLDTGDMLASVECPIGPQTNAAQLHDDLARLGPPLLLEVLRELPDRQGAARKQDDSCATYAHKIDKREGAIDWRQGAALLDRRIRAFNPFPVCYGELEGTRVRLWQARAVFLGNDDTPPGTIMEAGDKGILVRCGEGALMIEALQLPGGRVLDAAQVLSARREQFRQGLRFSLPADGEP